MKSFENRRLKRKANQIEIKRDQRLKRTFKSSTQRRASPQAISKTKME